MQQAESTRFSDAIAKWSVAGRPNDWNDYLIFAKAAEIMKKHVFEKARGLIASSGRRPLLYTYASDGTPLRATGTFMCTLWGPGGSRCGRSRG